MPLANACILTPIRFDATSKTIRVTVDATTETLTMGSLVVGRNYWVSGDAQADADGSVGGVGDLVTLLQTALTTHSVGNFTVTVSSTGTVTITLTAGTTFQILWADALTTLDETIFGFTNTALPSPAAASSVAANKSQGIWSPNRPIARDSRDRQRVVGSVATAISGLQRAYRLALPRKDRDMSWILLPKEKALQEYEVATEPFGSFEEAWVSAISQGYAFRVYDDEASRTSTSYSLYYARDIEEPLVRNGTYAPYWDVNLRGRRVT
jgi:hypothetical protein